jgi:hypothetical protein
MPLTSLSGRNSEVLPLLLVYGKSASWLQSHLSPLIHFRYGLLALRIRKLRAAYECESTHVQERLSNMQL